MLESSAAHVPAFAPTPIDEDTALMLRFKEGDPSAFAELYRRHHAAVLKTCRRILGNRGPAIDLAHDTFVTAFERRDQWSPRATSLAVRAWFTTIATRKCLDAIRRASARKEQPEPHAFETAIEPDARDPRCLEILFDAIAELPREQREIVEMKVDQELTYREIADLTGIPEPALKSRFRLARLKLSRHLERAGVTRDQLDD